MATTFSIMAPKGCSKMFAATLPEELLLAYFSLFLEELSVHIQKRCLLFKLCQLASAVLKNFSFCCSTKLLTNDPFWTKIRKVSESKRHQMAHVYFTPLILSGQCSATFDIVAATLPKSATEPVQIYLRRFALSRER